MEEGPGVELWVDEDDPDGPVGDCRDDEVGLGWKADGLACAGPRRRGACLGGEREDHDSRSCSASTLLCSGRCRAVNDDSEHGSCPCEYR